MTQKLLWASLALATMALLLGYGWVGQWLGLPAIVAVCALWLVGEFRHWDWITPVGLLLFVGMAAAGAALGAGPAWMLIAVVGALAAWDLSYFLRSLERVRWSGETRALEQTHLQRLLPVAGLSLLLGLVALFLKTRLSFWVVMLLGVIGFLCLTSAVQIFRRETD